MDVLTVTRPSFPTLDTGSDLHWVCFGPGTKTSIDILLVPQMKSISTTGFIVDFKSTNLLDYLLLTLIKALGGDACCLFHSRLKTAHR